MGDISSSRRGPTPIWLLSIVGIACFALVALAPTAWASGGRIAYMSNRGTSFDPMISLIKPNGSHRRALGVGGADPAISPSGKLVAYTKMVRTSSNPIRRHSALFVARSDGRHRRLLSKSNLSVERPVFSPNGKRILFRRGEDKICLIKTRGGSARCLKREGQPSGWSPDGKQILFTSETDLWVSRPDGSKAHRLFSASKKTYEGWASFSPNGRSVAFTRDPILRFGLKGRLGIYIADRHGKHSHRLTPNHLMDQYPSFSPDGSRIAFESTRDGDHGSGPEVYTMDLRGHDVERVTRDLETGGLGASFPRWGPSPR